MNIAIDIRETVGAKAGKGWYAFMMVRELLRQDPDNHYILYTQVKNSDFDEFSHAEQRVIPSTGWRWHWAVRQDLKRTRPDLFWATTSYLIPAFAPRGLRIFLTVHDVVAFVLPIGHHQKALLLERFTLRRSIRKAEKIVTVSRHTQSDLKTLFGVPNDKFILTPCAASKVFTKPLELSFLQTIRSTYLLPERFILGVGTLSPRKNFVRLIQAFKRLEREDLHLVLVGETGWKSDAILHEAKHPRIHRLGYVEGKELSALYHLAEVFVFPSLYEGFGIPPLEAMASGCPVIASNVSSLPEVVGEAGVLVDPYSVKDIAEAMERVLSDAALRKTLIERGFQQVKQFSWEESGRELLKVFEGGK